MLNDVISELSNSLGHKTIDDNMEVIENEIAAMQDHYTVREISDEILLQIEEREKCK